MVLVYAGVPGFPNKLTNSLTYNEQVTLLTQAQKRQHEVQPQKPKVLRARVHRHRYMSNSKIYKHTEWTWNYRGGKEKGGITRFKKKIYLTDKLTGKIHTVRMKYGFIYIFQKLILDTHTKGKHRKQISRKIRFSHQERSLKPLPKYLVFSLAFYSLSEQSSPM